MITIYDSKGTKILDTPINEGCKRRITLMKEDFINVRFSLDEPVSIGIGAYTEIEGVGLFVITDVQRPTLNQDTGGYDYDLQFNAHYWRWKNKIFFYTPQAASREAEWSLTATLDVHLDVFLRNLSALGYKYKGRDYVVSIDSTVEVAPKLVSYNCTSLLDALSLMAETWECEYWVTENIIHFGRCERPRQSAFTLECGVNAEGISAYGNRAEYATRLYAFGSTRNLPANYRPTEEDVVVNGIVQHRLMLPSGTPYIDSKAGLTTEEAVEKVVLFDDVYPRTKGEIAIVDTYTDTVTGDDGEEMTETFYRFTDDGFKFSKDYLLEGETLKVTFQSGKLNGMEFEVQFNPDGENEKLADGAWNPAAQVFEVVVNTNYGRKLPAAPLIPAVGDKYILHGWDSTKISELGLVAKAEQELLEKAQEKIKRLQIDPTSYTCQMMSDYVFEQGRLNDTDEFVFPFALGDAVNLKNKGYFGDEVRESRIIGIEYCLDIPYDSPILTIGESVAYSRLCALENKVNNLTYGGQTYQGTGAGGGSSVYVIGTGDTTPPSNTNVLSALRAILTFLDKTKDDRSVGQIASDIALEVGDFVSGTSGAKIWIDKLLNNQSVGEFDRLIVRVKAIFRSLLVIETEALCGELMVTPGGGIKCTDVEAVTAQDGTTVYRCWYLAEQDGVKTYCKHKAGDMAKCQSFNLGKGEHENVENRYYWRKVMAVCNTGPGCRTDDKGNRYGYVDLSATDCDRGSDIPADGDEIVQLGNDTEADRQTAIIISTVDSDSPSIKLYAGIDSYSLEGKCYMRFGYDHATGEVTVRWGKDESDHYLEYNQSSGLKICGDISVKSTIGGTNIDDYISNKTGAVTELYRLDLTNEMAPVVCDSNGNVTGSYPTSTARVFKGSTQLTSGVAYSIAKKEGITNVTISTSGAITMSGLTADRAEITVQATVDTVVLTAVMNVYKVKPGSDGTSITITSQSITYQVSTSGTTIPTGTWSANVPNVPEGQYLWTKTVVTYSDGTSTTAYSVSRYGVDGTSAKAVKVIADSQIMSYADNYTSGPTPTSVHLSAELQGTSGYQWSYKTPSMNSFVNISGATSSAYTLAYNNSIWGTGLTNKSITIRCTSSGVSDEVTIAKVSSGSNGVPGTPGADGADGYTVLLSNESHVFEGDTEKAVPTSVDCKIIAYKGNTKVPATIGAVTGGVGGMSMSYVNNGTTEATVRVYVTAGMTAKQGVLNIPITVDGQTFIRNFSWSLSLQGADGDSVTITSTDVLYCVGNYPTQPQDFRFTLTSLSGVTLKQGDYIWSKTIVAYSDGTSVVSYSASRIGADGIDGIGMPGADGKTSYVHFAYCSSINGSLPHPTSVSGFSTTSFAGAKYIGVCTDYTQADPTTHSSYEWNEYRGQDGEDGEDAVIYEIIPSVDQVLRDAEGNLTPTTVNCSVYKIKGVLRSLSNELSLRYKVLPDDTEWKSLSRSLGVSSNITVTDTAQSIVFELYSGSTVYDRETAPVLTDASGFSGGENLLKGTNQGTLNWKSYVYASAGTGSSSSGKNLPSMTLAAMSGAPHGVVAGNWPTNVYPYGASSQAYVPQSVSYQFEYATDSAFKLTSGNRYMVGFDILVKGNGPIYIFLEARRNNSSTWVTLTPWVYSGSITNAVLHIGARLNTLTSDLTNVQCIRLSVVATQTNEYTTSGSSQVGKYHIDSIEISNLKIEKGVVQTPWTPAPRDTNYLLQALKENTTISGGLVMTSRVAVGYTDANGDWIETGGLNGIATDYSGTSVSTAPILYCGGEMIDAARSTSGNYATSMIRLDGTAYFANNTVRMGYNGMEIGDNIVLDEDGLHLIDSGVEKLLVTNKSVGSLSNVQNSVTVNVSPASASKSMSFLRSTGASTQTQIAPLPGFYLKSMSDQIITVNSGTAVGTGGMSLNATIDFRFPLNGWQEGYNLEAHVAVLLQVAIGSGSFSTMRTYPMSFTMQGTTAVAQTVRITANLTAGNRYRIVISCTKSATPQASTHTIAGTITASGAATSTMNKNVLGNDGLVSVWGNTVLMAKSGEVTGIVGDASLRVRSWMVEMKYGSTPNNGIRIQSDGIWIYVPQTGVANWKRLDIDKLWGQGLLTS